MPEVHVHSCEGRSFEGKRAPVADITRAVVEHFQVPAENVMVEIVET